MMKKIWVWGLMSIQILLGAQTDNSFNSEFSHFAGGAALAGGITAIVNEYYPQYRQQREMIGFEVSSIGFAIAEGTNILLGAPIGGNLLDIACHAAGSAAGAYVTGHYILEPVVQTSPSEGKYIGLVMHKTF